MEQSKARNYYILCRLYKIMVVGDLVGEIAYCSDCHQKKKIALEWSRGTAKDGQIYAPFLRCENCAYQVINDQT